MNEEERNKLFSNIESDLWEFKHNVAYINNKDYYGLSRDLLDYIRKIEKENQQLKDKLKVYENPNDVTGMFKNCTELKLDLSSSKKLDKEYLENLINSIDDTKKYNKPVTMQDAYGITYEEIIEAKEKRGWNVVDVPLEELEGNNDSKRDV